MQQNNVLESNHITQQFFTYIYLNKLILVMNKLTAIIVFTLFSFLGFSQDVIIKRDGTKISANVIEITATTIKYRNFDQPEGPIRNIAINDVEEIIYNDGSWEKFEKVVETKTEEPSAPRITERKKKDFILDNGFFVEGIIGVNDYTERNTYYAYYDEQGNYYPDGFETSETLRSTLTSVGVRFGSKWYFGTREKWRPGLQATYLKLGIYVNPNSGIGFANSISLGNLGFANAFKLSESMGMEANANVGLNIMNFLPPFGNGPAVGLNYGAEVKFRYKVLAVGLDYSRMEGNMGYAPERRSMNVFSVSIGAKF